MNAVFEIENKEFKVEISSIGFIKYFYDGKLLQKTFSATLKDTFLYKINGLVIKIKVSLCSVKVFQNDQLLIDNLFPELTSKFKPFSFKRVGLLLAFAVLLNATLWFFLL